MRFLQGAELGPPTQALIAQALVYGMQISPYLQLAASGAAVNPASFPGQPGRGGFQTGVGHIRGATAGWVPDFTQGNSYHIDTGKRETGIIEKLLHNFGFVQCCDRNERLFFHFTAYLGDIHQLKNGDEVQFQETSDRRTGKPIAVRVS